MLHFFVIPIDKSVFMFALAQHAFKHMSTSLTKSECLSKLSSRKHQSKTSTY